MQDFYKQIKDSLDNFEMPYDENQWLRLQKTLKVKKIKKYTMMTSTIIFITSIVLYFGSPNDGIIANKTTYNNKISEIKTDYKINQPVKYLKEYIELKPNLISVQYLSDNNDIKYLTDEDIDSIIPIINDIDETQILSENSPIQNEIIKTENTDSLITDTLNIDTTLIPKPTYYFPTAFSPNGDGINDEFFPIGIDLINMNFQLLIYDRWGNIVYESMNIDYKWNGENCKNGIYIWIFRYQDTDGKIHNDKGQVTLIK